jgi:hypothetical protein
MEADSTAARNWLIQIERDHEYQALLRENWAFGAGGRWFEPSIVHRGHP